MRTQFLLLAEFGTALIPLSEVGKRYFEHSENQVNSWARQNKYPFPILRLGGQKAKWVVSIEDFAQYVDSQREKAKEEFELLNG